MQCERAASSLERVLHVGLRQSGATRAEFKERMEEVDRREHAALSRYVGLVGVQE